VNRPTFFSLFALLAVLSGCARPPLSGPPELRLGRDECRECGMLISEDRCCAALLLERDGVREYALFDDLGCLLDFERTRLDGAVVVDRFARDYAARQWIPAGTAAYLLAEPERLVTPMSSGMVAFAASAAADEARGRFGGRVLDLAGLQLARAGWAEVRAASASRPVD
jgi:hypothetical protein